MLFSRQHGGESQNAKRIARDIVIVQDGNGPEACDVKEWFQGGITHLQSGR